MKIGRQADPNTSICTSDADTITVRGFDLSRDLIGTISLTEHFFLLVTGSRPSAGQLRLLDATLVAIAEHGLVPSVQASRMTLAAAPEALQGAVAAGILGCGSVILGSAETAGRFFQSLIVGGSEGLSDRIRASLTELRAARRPIPGYGHPQHKGRDARASRLLQIAEEIGIAGAHVAAALEVERLLPELVGRPLPLNVSGAIPAVLLDAGIPVEALKGVPILARTASLIAHLVEEQRRPIGFVLAEFAEKGVGYDGPPPPPTTASNQAHG
jgi:citrate synthase